MMVNMNRGVLFWMFFFYFFFFLYSGVLFVKVNFITVQWFVFDDCLYHHGTVACYW